ncbi:MAG: hypothetical protein ACRBI6_01605 [Acidimicrobiales bacterium]
MESHRRGTPPEEGPSVELLGVAGQGRVEDSTVHATPSRRWWVGIGGLALALLVFVLLGSGGEESAPASSTTTEPPTTSETPTTTARPTTTRRSTIARPFDDEWNTRVVGEAPLLGEETGGWLLVADGTLEAIDLDAGLEYDLGIDAGIVWWSDGDWVIIDRYGEMVAIDLTTFEESPVAIFGQPTTDEAPRGQVWFRSWPVGDPTERLVLIDLATGAELESIELPNEWGYWSQTLGPQLVGSPRGGGVYRLDGQGVERIIDQGYLLAVDEGRFLVDRCDEQLLCAWSWIDERGAPVADLETPPTGFDAVRPVGTSWWLALEAWHGEYELALFDPRSGRTVDIDGLDWAGSLTVSPDGRWVALPDNGRLTIRDLDAPDGAPIDLGPLFSDTAAWLDAPLDLDGLGG